jgi:hypothetical protein
LNALPFFVTLPAIGPEISRRPLFPFASGVGVSLFVARRTFSIPPGKVYFYVDHLGIFTAFFNSRIDSRALSFVFEHLKL